MATVEVLSKARMEQIEDNSVVSGTIDVSNHLILTKHGGATIDAGLLATGDVDLSSVQTFTGVKTFNAGTLLDKGSTVYNVKAYGAIGDNTADDTAEIQAAIDACNANGGGTVFFPPGVYKISSVPIKLYSGTPPAATPYDNITLTGIGATISQTTTGVDVLKASTSGGVKSENMVIENLKLTFAGTATNSGNGLYISQPTASSPLYSMWQIRNVLVTNCQGTGKYAFNIEGMTASKLSGCFAYLCANGFYFNGGASGNFTSVCNTVTVENCYAYMGANGINGFRLTEGNIVSHVACGVYYNAISAGTAYLVECGNSISFMSCGFEVNGTATLAAGFKITVNSLTYGSNQCKITAGYSYQSKSTKEVWITGGGSNAIVEGYKSNGTVSGSTGLTVDGGATEIACAWPTIPRDINPYSTWVMPGIPRVTRIASSATPQPATWNDVYHVTAAAANMTVGGPTGTAPDGQLLEIQYRDNGVARTIAHDGIYMNGPAAMATTTIVGKVVREIFAYNSVANKWVCMEVGNWFY